MSLSKELCLRSDSQNSHSFSDCLVNKFESKEDNYRRDSFDDRFCDDLCEDILQYLSLEDKLRFESVSKQFQRTVFKRQYELYINLSPGEHKYYLENKEGFGYRRGHKYYYIEDQSLDSFEALLKKCPNITSIELETHHLLSNVGYNPEKFNQIFQLIIENCYNLSEVIVWKGIALEFDLNDRNFEEFHQKFGPKMKYLRSFRKLNDLNLFPNIERITINNEQDVSLIPQLKLDKLKKLEIDFYQGKEHMLQTFIDKIPKLTHLEVFIDSEDENAIYKSLKNISKLKHLIHFCFHNDFEENNTKFWGLLKQMANNCKNLKSIECGFVINDQNSEIRQFLSQLTAFPALKRLNLWFYSVNNEVEANIDVNQLFSFELFKGFSNITHLTLGFNWTKISYLIESTLEDIVINLPKLQYLEIIDTFDTTPEAVIKIADILSRISRLQTLKLNFKSGVDYKPIEEQITKKCRKIKKIQIKTFN